MHMHSYLKRSRRIKFHSGPSASWSIPELYTKYNGATGLPGGGVISIVELGGGWNQADVARAFAAMKLPAPTIEDISVDGTTNSMGTDADGEVALDIQVAGGVYAAATGKAAHIKIYWAQDIALAVAKAAADNGEMLIFAASGDNDSADGGQTPANVDCPASCPSVIGCGGTLKPKLGVETVWNNNPGRPSGVGTGGGFSIMFPAQAWQIGAPPSPRWHRRQHNGGRMVPDVAANADPASGYQVVLNGDTEIVGGTSAVAPFYAGMFAAIGYGVCSISWGADEVIWERGQQGSCAAMEKAAAAAVGSLKSVVETLWKNPTLFGDVTEGDNGFYKAAVGPDPCTGLGVPNVTAIAALLSLTA